MTPTTSLPPAAEFISVSDLARYRERLSRSLLWGFDVLLGQIGKDLILRLPGAAHLTQQLYWDFNSPTAVHGGQRIAMLVVDGDLRLDQDLLNLEGDHGPGLLVLGELSARHLVHGGAVWLVSGDVRASGVVLGHYNHGSLLVAGAIHARLLLVDDHHVEAGDGVHAEIAEDPGIGEAVIAEVLDCSEGDLRVDLDALIARIVAGRPVLRERNAQVTLLDAVLREDAEGVVAALAAGADANAVGAGGTRALMIAARQGRLDLVELLLRAGAQLGPGDDEGRTALHYAAAAGHAQVLGVLLSAVADIEALDHSGNSPLAMAVALNHAEAARLLLATGARPSAPGNGARSLLLQALAAQRNGHGALNEALAIALIEAGVDVSARDRDGVTAVLAAAADASPRLLRALRSAAADFAVQARFGELALGAAHFAALKGNAANLACLLDEGLAVEQCSGACGVLALALALGGEDAMALAAGKADRFRPFDEQRVAEGRLEAVRCLLAHGASAAGAVSGIPLTHISPDPRVMQLLLNAGAEVDACDNAGYSTLQRVVTDAAAGRDVELARQLLARGADPCREFPDSGLPLHEGLASSGDLELLGAIIEALCARRLATTEAITGLLQTALRARERNRRLFLLQYILQLAAQKGLATSAGIARERPQLSFEVAGIERDNAALQAAIERSLAQWPALRTDLEPSLLAQAGERQQDKATVSEILRRASDIESAR